MNRKALGGLVLIVTAFAVLVGAEQAKSQAKPKPAATAKMLTTFSGEIVAVDAQAHTFAVRRADGHEMKFRAEAGSKVMVNGQAKSVTDLARGEHVKVSYTGSGDVLTATTVTGRAAEKEGLRIARMPPPGRPVAAFFSVHDGGFQRRTVVFHQWIR